MKTESMKNAFLSTVLLISLGISAQGLAQQAPKEHGQGREMGKHPKRPEFSQLDVDGDGEIVLEEFKQHEIPRRSHEEIFSHIDADGNGAITRQEFIDHKPPCRPRQN